MKLLSLEIFETSKCAIYINIMINILYINLYKISSLKCLKDSEAQELHFDVSTWPFQKTCNLTHFGVACVLSVKFQDSLVSTCSF